MSLEPLAYKIRPDKLSEFVGQDKIFSKNSWLVNAIKNDRVSSLILFGPPGSGKTTLANIIAKSTEHNFVTINATERTTAELKKQLKIAQENFRLGKKTIIFIDEIHRFNKAQQDILLPFVEKGEIILIGATTENPSFTVVSPIISRSKVIQFDRLGHDALDKILNKAIKQFPKVKIDKSSKETLISNSNGDARILLNLFEDLARLTNKIDKTAIDDSNISQTLKYDRDGEEHYNIISALHKSMRDSDADAAVYWMLRMIDAGDDPLYIARRLIRFASEDIGIADPHALLVATSAYHACHFIGLPECDVILAQAAIHLALAPKSNACYSAVLEAREDIKKFGNLDVPLHIRNAPTKMMKELGYGAGYKYAHEFEGAKVTQQHLPDKIKGRKYYRPTDRGLERKIKEREDEAKSKGSR